MGVIQRTRPARTFGRRIATGTYDYAWDRFRDQRVEAAEPSGPEQAESSDAEEERQFREWLSDNLNDLVELAREHIVDRLREVAARGLTLGVRFGQGDEAWVQRVIENFTGLAYDSANRVYSGAGDWRQIYQQTGNFPVTAVCDQLGELIQWIRGITGYGAGLAEHYGYYLRNNLIHNSPTADQIQPGATDFSFAPSGTSHAFEIESGDRYPTPEWTQSEAQSLRREQVGLLRSGRGSGMWDARVVGRLREAARSDPALAQRLNAFDRRLDRIYHPNQLISHESTILRTAVHNGETWIQLFDFANHVAQEGTVWQRASVYGAGRHLGYQPSVSSTRHPAMPRGKAEIVSSHEGREVERIDLSQVSASAQGSRTER